VRESDIISEADLTAKLQSVMERRPLRLVFGGRLTAIKGVLELPKIARELRRLGVNFSMHIFGSGDLERQLQTDISGYGLQQEVHLGGVLDFQSGWIPFLKEKADVFVCCHPQGDPSSTYPEVMSCGVPIAGYDNEAFVGIIRRSGCGWMSPMLDPVAMAEQIMRLDRDRAEIHESAYRARAFAAAHAFETTFAARIAHIKSLSRLPERLRTRVSC
jgi:glycosyltransferase involved in cell wall biosynthesis